ncbi:MAG: TlpA family protein disulfide reductase [Ignavibacteria bacterium]|nr:TlpA family protein disulfide reductase [Ignavibacteria bacterium]
MKKIAEQLISKKAYYIVLHIAVIVLAIQVVVLSSQNKKLKQPRAPSIAEQLQVGDTLVLHRLELVQDGSKLDTTSRRQMIFIFTTTCPFCKEIVPTWNELSVMAQSSLSVFAVSLDSKDLTSEYIKQNRVSYPVLVANDAKTFKKINKTHVVPQTILVERNGKVQKVWTGKLSQENLKEVAALISGH